MTTYQAAQKVRTYLMERYALEGEPEVNLPSVWSTAKSNESGWEFLRGCVNVVWEGEYEWPMAVTEAIYAGKLELPGIFCEPATGWALSFYKD